MRFKLYRSPTLLTLACLVISGCGYVGEPLYPALNIPLRIVDLAAVERGDKLEISFTLTAVTTEGLAIKTPGPIDLRVGPAAPGVQTNQWAESARSVPVTSPEKPQNIQASVPIADFVGKDVLVGVRVAGSKGRYSDWSNLYSVPIEAPLPTPASLAAVAVPEGVQVSWLPLPNAPPETKFKIFRKTGDQAPVQLGISDEPKYLDTSTEYGKTYTYYVQAVHNKTESDVAETAPPLTPVDIFPPAVPAALTASAAVSSVELAWERDTEPDLKGYRIFRAVGDGPFELLAEVEVPSYSDTKVETGKRYRYRVTAIDQTGHESLPSAEATATLP